MHVKHVVIEGLCVSGDPVNAVEGAGEGQSWNRVVDNRGARLVIVVPQISSQRTTHQDLGFNLIRVIQRVLLSKEGTKTMADKVDLFSSESILGQSSLGLLDGLIEINWVWGIKRETWNADPGFEVAFLGQVDDILSNRQVCLVFNESCLDPNQSNFGSLSFRGWLDNDGLSEDQVQTGEASK